MRSQASKTLPKKGATGKTAVKGKSATKSIKKRAITPKKVQNLQKSLLKSAKKNTQKDQKDEVSSSTSSAAPAVEETKEQTGEAKEETSKTSQPRSNSPTKKLKKEPKEKKDEAKNTPSNINTKATAPKKCVRVPKITNSGEKIDNVDGNNDDVKYKINVDSLKKNQNSSKIKPVNKKAQTPKKRGANVTKLESQDKETILEEDKNKEDKQSDNNDNNTSNNTKADTSVDISKEIENETKVQESVESNKSVDNSPPSSSTSCSTSSRSQVEMPRTESERPLKFFTSSRSPRTVDIDVKCCKYSKGNVSASERFLPMKCETKIDEHNKEKSTSNHLVSQGSEFDVYTFTDKVDSPKSILSDYRNTNNKSIGRVRPIARVKGTIVDKKTDTERKKYSPHRPIEEVVKQLKANKRSEGSTSGQRPAGDRVSDAEFNVGNVGDKPQPIVSKSYKMVARKSSITGKPFSPIKFFDHESSSPKSETSSSPVKVNAKQTLLKKQQKQSRLSDKDIDNSKFSLRKKSLSYSSSEESVNDSNDDNESKESSGSDSPKAKKTKNKKFKRITDSQKKPTSKELKELSKDSLVDLKDNFSVLCNEKPSKRRLKLLSMWAGPKKHRMASLNAIAKVHCLYENESRTHMELGLMKTVDRQPMPSTSKTSYNKKKEKSKDVEKQDSTSESEYEVRNDKKEESSESSDDNLPQRTLRGVPGIRSAGKYWDPKSSTSSSEDSEIEQKPKTPEKKKTISKPPIPKPDNDKSTKQKKTTGMSVKKKRNRNEVVMDLKDMVVQKRMASLNATAILAASYEKRSPKSSKDETTSDSGSDESFTHKSKNVIVAGVKSELKNEETKKDVEDTTVTDRKQKVEVIVNQESDVTITGVYSTHHHEGFCTVSGMQYRISSTSHTQTTATANCEKEGCPREEGSRYTPLSALSSMQPPAEHPHTHPHPVPELGGLSRRAGCSSAFSAPSPSAHHDPGYYQPAGPLIKESGAEADRALGRYHPAPHYHPPHPSMLQQYGPPPYYPAELCYGRYYRPPGPYHIPPPQPDAPMVGVGSDPYPPPQYYGSPPCYQHSPQRIPYVEYRGCPCPLNACPKNVLIGPATGKAPAGGGPADVLALAPPGGAFRAKVRACALDSAADTHGSGKDPPLEPEPPAAADAPHPCPLPTIGGASPKRELFDVRDNLHRAGDMPNPAEALGPPSPARGSAGACAPQPPPVAPRRARLGKAMARRTLAGDDTGFLLSTPQQPTPHSDVDDDVLAISPPICVPIDLSSSDERSTPLVDVKKENEGPTYTPPRKVEAQALREHNSTTALPEIPDLTEANKAVKRRYSKPKLEIDIRDIQLDDACKTNGIGEHVKLQKRRKVSDDHTDVVRIETVTKEAKKKTTPSTKRTPKSPPAEKKNLKRKLEDMANGPKAKKALIETINDDPRLKNVAAVAEEPCIKKSKTKSALLLDNLIRKNSIDGKGYASDKELNPAELFLSPNENVAQNVTKKTLNINNNIVENTSPTNGVRPKTIAAVSQLIEKKLAYKNACKIDSKITHNLKSVLKSPTDTSNLSEEHTSKVPLNNGANSDSKIFDKCESILIEDKNEKDSSNDGITNGDVDKAVKTLKINKNKPASNQMETSLKTLSDITSSVDESQCKASKLQDQEERAKDLEETLIADKMLKKPKSTIEKPNGELKSKNVEKVVKLLVSKKQAKSKKVDEPPSNENQIEQIEEKTKNEKPGKRCKLGMDKESKGKSVEKLAKLLVSKKTALKMDEATLLVEAACASPTPRARGGRRRRSGGRRARRAPAPLTPLALQPRPPRAPPRWSNGWNWDGEHYVSKVYLNNDSRLDRTARCWARMWHASGDRVARGDCVLLRASLARAQPFVARVASLWENPDDGEMMVSLVWYYRPEHTERGRQADDAPDEVFASRHRDANSVACIEDKCYVLTFNEYCRYRKRLKASEEGITMAPSIVPPLPAGEVTPTLAPNDTKLPPSVSPELVLFCRKIYDFRSKKIHMPNK
ncbi:uncharacterized protein LOC106710819 [Papilio machaon]|uniref:uncharacterized protein LOC106710819 n=1 Tax=Papilio machaon TaxID=76193 RepID=UPI001E66385B|nr:uncharacterized protein LOC106710819 [Papilio machaon]